MVEVKEMEDMVVEEEEEEEEHQPLEHAPLHICEGEPPVAGRGGALVPPGVTAGAAGAVHLARRLRPQQPRLQARQRRLGYRASGVRYQVSGNRCQVLGDRCHMSGVRWGSCRLAA